LQLKLIPILLMFFTAVMYSQQSCELADGLDQIFKVENKKYGERDYLQQTINDVDASLCYAELINKNKAHINYLRQHFTKAIDYEKLQNITDPIKLQEAYIEALKQEKKFISLIEELSPSIREVNNKHLDTISLDAMLNIAVKYFTVKGITDEGDYLGKVCAGINGITWTEKTRQPHLEAFCFSAILDNLKSGAKPNLQEEFIEAVKEIRTLNLGINKEEQLLRAQGATYILMRTNEALINVLQNAYLSKKQYLLFALVY